MWQSLLTFLGTYLSTIQTIAVLVGLAYVAMQTRQLGRQLKLSNIAASSAYFREINQLSVHDQAVREASKTSLDGALAHIYLGTFKARFLLKRAHLLDKATWESDKVTMIRAFQRTPILLEAWNKDKEEYPVPFQKFLDIEIISQAFPRSANEEAKS